jgi:hypothetical protein
MDQEKSLAGVFTQIPDEKRRHPRFSWKVPLRIHCRSGELIFGRTVDISESGISAIIPLDLIAGQAVELGFQLPSRAISLQATVKNQTAFRYGFEFVLGHEEREIIMHDCRELRSLVTIGEQ